MADNQEQVLGEVEVKATKPTFTQINGPYGFERVPVQDLAEPTVPSGTGSVIPDGDAIQLDNNLVQGDLGFNSATAARTDRENFLDSNILEGMGAAIQTWDATRLVKRLARPTYAGEEPINQFEYLENTPLNLDEDEREYFLDVGKGTESAAYAIQQIEDRRLARRVVGDHEIAGMATAFVDPLWLLVPPALRIGKVGGTAGRVVAGVSGAGLAGAVTAAGEGPVSDEEIALSMAMNGAVSTVLYRSGKGLVKADPEFPDVALDTAIQNTKVGALTPDLPVELRAGTVNSDAAKVADAVEMQINNTAKATGIGEKLQWNMRKTMSNFGPAGKRIADTLFDNNSDLSLTSVESQREAILGNLRSHQYQYEDLLRQSMAEQGAGLLQMVNPASARKSHAVQQGLEVQVQRELFRREQYSRLGMDIAQDAPAPNITKMADALDRMHQVALKEMQAAGVEGADNLLERPGYLNRKWSSSSIDNAISRLESTGITREVAHKKLVGLVGLSIRRANNMDKDIANQIGQAIVDRALRKGYFEDALFNAPAGEGQMKQLRDILKGSGMSHQDVERALNVLRVSSDDAGKASILKHRMDIDYKATTRVGNEEVSVMDLIDPNVTSIVDQYTRQVATTSAFARKGLTKRSDIENLRSELLHDTPVEQRKQAADLFDDVMNHMRGLPAGAAMNENFRLMQSYGRTITLAWSGLWQMTEYATVMGKYGLAKTLKYCVQEFPGFKQLLGASKQEAGMLNTVLAEHSSQSLRLRPYLSRFEDGYEMNNVNAASLSAQTWGDLVPMANAMKYVHHHQARVVGNLVLDRLDQAAKGNKAAREALQGYGLEAPVMDRVAAEIKQHGYKVDNWDDKVWGEVRPAFAKMMDESVLRERLGDMPAFAKFDQVGKFVFTYRSFVLTAHNKVLAGMAERNGVGAVGLILMYQLPLSLLAVSAQNGIKGGKTPTQDELIAQALGQMGGLGLFSEPLRWASGQSNSVGAPALIPIDRGIKLLQSGASGDGAATASTAMTMLPVVSAIPFVRGMANQIKE